MIIGIGIDTVDINRIKHWLSYEGMLERFFHPHEINDICSRKAQAVHSVAARFAAKEAYGKALGTGLKGITLKNITVINNPAGKPILQLFDDALIPFQRLNGKRIHLSLTHEKNIAIACVILEGES
ncbi:MAG: holo-ACP synthase [Treponema sp.]